MEREQLCDDPSLEKYLRGHKASITSLDFNPATTQLVSGSHDNTLMVWNIKSQMRAFRYVGHQDAITKVKFSPSGHLIASASMDKTIRLWVPTIKGENTVFKAHTAPVQGVDFSSDGDFLATCSYDKTIKLWSVHRQRFQFSLSQHSNWVKSVEFSPDGRLLLSSSDDKTVRVWDVASKQCVHTFYEQDAHPTTAKFHPSGTCVGSASGESVKIWDIRMNKLLQHYQAHTATVCDITFHANGDVMTSASLDTTMKMYDLVEGRLLYTLHGHQPHAATCVTAAKQDNIFASGGADDQILVWKFDINSPKIAKSKNGHQNMSNTSRHSNSNMQFTKSRSILESKENISSDWQSKTQNDRPMSANPSISANSAVSPDIAIALETISGQMDILTQTVAILEQRLTMTENKLREVLQSKDANK